VREISTERYFDHNATAPLRAVARKAWEEALESFWSNPSSPHAGGVRCRALLEQARESLGQVLQVSSEDLVFTSGATEGNNSVLAHFFAQADSLSKVAVSAVEHPSVLHAAKQRFGGKVIPVAVDSHGVLSLDALAEVLNQSNLELVSVAAANNETGVIQPWSDALGMCREAKVPFHCDVTQWLGRIPVEGLACCDFLTGSFHKLGGPKGVGFMKTTGLDSTPLLFGGEQERGRRAGTENLPAILAALAALEEAVSEVSDSSPRDLFESRVQELVPGTEILAKEVERLPNVSALMLSAFENLRWINRLDRLGFAVSTGSACATANEAPSHVLAAMGLQPEAARRVIRVSGGWSNNAENWDELADSLGSVYRELSKEEDSSQVVSL
jgi:cysteine desulfurase